MREGWSMVPHVGTYVEADHPITSANPTKAFRVHQVRADHGKIYARGMVTMWFNVEMLRPATPENAIAAEQAESAEF